MDNLNFKQLGEATSVMISLHFDAFMKYMKLTDGDIGTSISLANGLLHEIVQMNTANKGKEVNE